MAGTREGGLKAAATNKKRYPGFYKRIGSAGGKKRSNENRGFAANREFASEMGKRGAAARIAGLRHSENV